MKLQKNYKFWFCTGSQDLYGDECLAHVAAHSKEIVAALNASGVLPYEVVWKPTLITNELIRKTFNEANIDEECAGVITWMHTFSPAKSWILGLQELRKPLLHLHTQSAGAAWTAASIARRDRSFWRSAAGSAAAGPGRPSSRGPIGCPAGTSSTPSARSGAAASMASGSSSSPATGIVFGWQRSTAARPWRSRSFRPASSAIRRIRPSAWQWIPSEPFCWSMT